MYMFKYCLKLCRRSVWLVNSGYANCVPPEKFSEARSARWRASVWKMLQRVRGADDINLPALMEQQLDLFRNLCPLGMSSPWLTA